jgi:DNA-binding CsgD family transcriptional regulator
MSPQLDAFDDSQNGTEQRKERLTGRETTILRRVALGESNKMIARQFGISESTVKVHIKTILRKIRARNRTQAAIWAFENGIGGESSGRSDYGNARPHLPASLETGGSSALPGGNTIGKLTLIRQN